MNQHRKPSRLWKQTRSRWLLGIPIGGFIALVLGALGVVTFHGVMDFTNTNEFCYGCHIGRDTIVEEYQASVHFNNRSGVIATCADCHVPKPFVDKMIVKVKATADIYYQLMETVTLENFEQERLRLAEHVWRDMAASNSRECRSCHTPERWDSDAQPIRVRTNHQKMLSQNMNCIDCHQGVAHKRPVIE
ncbi:cytochrome C [Corallincola holothuriorum]|uniref:Cytochrome c-type protein n=1 Tax=Corallincola holothuriorum TaxID=2282215 RepID=A0A368NKW4_9GAMM|nr:NapC/NirT family cytochrome c [Corallincola holothuriorum]RCU50806.1 cytochrome C [Corallincola holothuriorum]